MIKNLTHAEFQSNIKTLAKKLYDVLPTPDGNVSYELIGVGKQGIVIATGLQSILSSYWKNPIGLSMIIKPRKKANPAWKHIDVDNYLKFHKRKILVDAVVYTGGTYKELMEIYPDASFAALYSFKEFSNCHFAEKIDKDFKIIFPNETEDS